MAKKQKLDFSVISSKPKLDFSNIGSVTQEEQEQPVKKKVQEDTESVSEDGSLESQEVTEEVEPTGDFDLSPVGLGEDGEITIEQDFSPIDEEAQDVFQTKKKNKESQEQAVSYVGANLTDDQLLSKSTQDLADELDTDIYSSDLNFALKGRKNDIINARTKEYSEEVKKSQIDSLLSEGLPQAEADSIYVSTKKDNLLKSGIKVLGLDEEEVLKYSDSITEYYTLRNKGSERTDEENIKLVGLGEEIKNLREDMNAKEFINPETNNIDQEKAEESIKLVTKYEKELKTDQQKFSERYSSERDKLKYLEKELLSMFDEGSGKDGITRSSVIEDIPSVLKGGEVLDHIYMRDEAEEAVNKYKSLYEEYEDTKSNFSALSRALLLNEDPASVSRGLGESDIPYLGAVMNVIGNVVTAGGESLIEESTGFNVQTDSDFASKIVQIANEEGVKVTPEQAERAIPGLDEKVGAAMGASLPMMAEIMVNTVVGNKVKGVLGIPKLFSKIKYLKNSPKITKLLDNTLEATQQALVFEFTSGGSAAMGVGEFLGEKGFEKAISKLGGKYGKVFKLLGKTLSAGAGATVGEYAGDFAEQSFKSGFLSEKSFKETFGRDYDEGLDKFLVTAIMSTVMGAGSQVGSFLSDSQAYYDSIGDTQRSGEIQQLIDANKANDLVAKVKSGEATIEELESVLGSGKDKPKKLDDMSKEELDAYTKENDIELEDEIKTEEKVKSLDEKGIVDKIDNKESINEAESEVYTNKIYDLIDSEEVVEGSETESKLYDLIEKVENYERKTETVKKETTETRLLTRFKQNAGKINRKAFRDQVSGSKSTFRGKDGTIEVSGGKVIFKTKDGSKTIGNTADILTQDFTTDNILIDSDGNVTGVRITTPDGEVTISNPEVGLDMGIQLQEKKLGRHPMSDVEAVYSEVLKEESIEVPVPKEGISKIEEITPTTEGDTFTEEDLDTEITTENKQSFLDKLDRASANIKKMSLADPTGIVAIVDGMITLMKKSIEAGITIREAFKQAKSKYKSSQEYKDLSLSDKKKFNSFNEDSIFNPVATGDTFQKQSDTLADKSKKEYDKQKNSGKNTEEAAKETFRKVFKNASWFNKLSKEDQATVEADFNNRLVEKFENPSPKKNQVGKPPKSKDTSDKVVTTKMKQLKEKWKNQDKGITEGKREALKTVKESQSEFQKDLNEVTKYLSESKRKRAELLLRNVKDQKTLGEARTKLDELISDKTVYVTAKESEIDEQLKKAEKAAEKNLTIEQRKRLKEIAKELKGRIKGKVNLRTAVQLTRKLAGLDPFNVEKVAEFRDFVETVLDKSENEGAKSRVESKLKSAIKALRKYKGERDVLARELKEVDYSKVKDKKLYEEVVDALLDSAKKKVDIKEDSVSIKDVDIRKAISKLKQEQQGYLEEKFQESGYSDTMTYNEYKEMISNDTQKTEEEIADKLAADKEKRKAIFEGTKRRLNEVKPTGSLKQRKVLDKLKQLINQDGFYENMGDKNIADLFQAVEEMYNLDSAAGLSKIQAEISGIQKGINLKKYSDSKGGIFSKTGSAVWKGALNTNWDNFASAVSKKLKYAQEFTAELFAEWDVAQARADTRSAEISNTIDSMMGETRAYSKAISDKGNQKIGVVSDLLMYDEGSTTEEIQEDFENKIKSVKEAIKREESIMNESWDYGHDYLAARRRKIALEEALDVVDKFNTREELQNAVDNGEVLTDKEAKLYNEVKRIGAEIREEFEEASYLHSGKKIKRVVNYVPTQARSLNKKSEVEASKTGTGLSTNLTGRSKTKVSSRNITDKNYDFSSVAKSGLTEVIVDIETLPSKLELKSLINSNAFNDLFESGKESPLRKEVVKYINGIADARRNMTASDTIKRARLAGVLDNIFKSTIALPLKHSFQVINQTVPIALQTLNDVGIKGVSQAVSALTSSDPDVKARLDDVFSRSQSKNRTAMGDAQIDKSTAPIEKLLRNSYSPEGRGNIASRTYQKLVSDVLKNSDYWIAKVSFVAAYMKELRRAGVDFLDAPIDNKIISKADTITNQINNASDFTKTKQGINSDKANKSIKNLLFLYKSFVQNQAVVFYSNAPKAARGEVDALRRITGQLIGLYTFQALSRGTASLLGDAVGELFDLDDEDIMLLGLNRDQAKKKFKKEGLQKERENVLGDIGASTFSDLVTGWMPNILDGAVKDFINKSVSSVTVSDDDRLELKALGLTEEEFLDNYKNEFPGSAGVLNRYYEGLQQSLEIISNPNVPSSYKNVAYSYIVAVLIREGLMVKGLSSKLGKLSRSEKQLEKLVNSKQK